MDLIASKLVLVLLLSIGIVEISKVIAFVSYDYDIWVGTPLVNTTNRLANNLTPEPHYIAFGQKNIISGLPVVSTNSPVLKPNPANMISRTSVSEYPANWYLQIIAIATWTTRHYAKKVQT